MVALLRCGCPDPWLADYSGKTPLDLALDCGRSRLEIADALAHYAATQYAPTVGLCLAAADRGSSRVTGGAPLLLLTPAGAVGAVHTAAGAGVGARAAPGSPNSLGSISSPSTPVAGSCPFRFLSALGSDALGLIQLFVTAPPTVALAALADNRARAKGEGYRSTNYTGHGHAYGSPRGGKDAQKYEHDPRARSLPYLMRQSERAAAASTAGKARTSPPPSPNASVAAVAATAAAAALMVAATTGVAAESTATAAATVRTEAHREEDEDLARAIAASLDLDSLLGRNQKQRP